METDFLKDSCIFEMLSNQSDSQFRTIHFWVSKSRQKVFESTNIAFRSVHYDYRPNLLFHRKEKGDVRERIFCSKHIAFRRLNTPTKKKYLISVLAHAHIFSDFILSSDGDNTCLTALEGRKKLWFCLWEYVRHGTGHGKMRMRLFPRFFSLTHCFWLYFRFRFFLDGNKGFLDIGKVFFYLRKRFFQSIWKISGIKDIRIEFCEKIIHMFIVKKVI
ncbi:MAG: hypothetical protein ACD_78C00084G0001 [uncultured bacterium (gcode 4)]|uniref:Uncharacterized protein n=1 Tax=uncultured bacterium (gcode 4) TaxID=1234023 RepID=K1YY54_9BACT|nr:MAG: hypothetical protein ACD_78C00084G0001 [uncultured bacterium (gcode 4)]